MSNSLAAVHPELVAEWSEKNLPLTPDSITFGSNKKVWWNILMERLDWVRQVKTLESLTRVLENGFLYTNAMDQQVYLINPKTKVTQKH